MITKTSFPGKYIQGSGAIEKLAEEVSKLGKKGFMVCGPLVFNRVLPAIKDKISAVGQLAIENLGGECCEEEIERLKALAEKAGSDVIIGMGGGKALDTAKAVAHGMGAPVVIVPTSASSDAPCTSVAVLYTPNGKFSKIIFLANNPDVVLVDTQIVARAPVRLLVAGMGDALSTKFEAESNEKRYQPNICGYPGSLTAYELARLCYRVLLEYGVTAKRACEAGMLVPAVEHVIEANTLLSGVGVECTGTAAAHSISNGLTVISEAHGSLHGEKVAFGVLASLFLTDKPREVIDEVYDFAEAVGLPMTLDDLGITGASDEQIRRIAESACAPGEPITVEAVPVTPETVFAAMKVADLEGKRRKGV